METKKNPDVEVSRNSSLYFAVGLNILLLSSYLLLEYKTYEKNDIVIESLSMAEDRDEDIPITNIMSIPPPPPPPPPVVQEVIKVVDNEIEIEETVLESTETDQDEVIADRREVSIDDVSVDDIEEEVEVPFAVVEQVPIFPGCSGNNKALIECFKLKIQEHIKENFVYPENALESNKQGKVYVLFTIDTKGCIGNLQSRGPYKILEHEAERIISLLPKMKPAKQRNVPVKVSYSIPITFKFIEQ